MRQKTYLGFYSPKETWADNRPLYRNVLEGKSNHCSLEEARRQLAHFERFDPLVPHDRLVAHSLLVYCIEHPGWKKGAFKSKVATPFGTSRTVLEADLGVELVRIAGGEPYVEEVISRDVVRALGDGTFIRGTLFRKVLPQDSVFSQLEEYVTISFDKSGYVFVPRKDIQRRERVFGYEVTAYVSIDGQRTREQSEWCVPGFHLEDSGRSGFKQWVRRKGLE